MSTTARESRPRLTGLAAALTLPALLIALTGCSGSMPGASDEPSETSEPSASAPAEESMEQGDDEVITIGLQFMPETITVPVGTTVTWRNGETIGHTVTSGAWGDVNESTGLRGSQTADGLFDHALAPMGQEGDTFSFTFDEAGEYPYFCQPHLTMNAMVIVEE
ncbi:MAG: plastocyanin/azurin family copper-binding protein [Microcella pacifica]|jgi:plastocyanin|uniref:HcpC n=1 Tax=Microcella pacifica TaxID=2591847 RepID=A0A9E5JR55_9MICO|nr:plastocyanin/azurin family copper-binding protein [Microcella pacifica]MBR21151.1 HcpC [Leifsonia sp.]NHF64152.1 HcpC [Microcella pacifica]